MKTADVCPKCQGKDIFHSPSVMDRGEANVAMCMAIRRSDPIHAREIGRFEVYVCKGCGYSELYVIDPTQLEDGSLKDDKKD